MATDVNYPVTYGATLTYSTSGSSGSFVAVGTVQTINPPEIKQEAIDMTNHGSGNRKIFRPSPVIELGEMEATVIMSGSTVVNTVSALQTNQNIYYWKLIFPTATPVTLLFQAFVTSFKPADMDAKSPDGLTFTLKLQPTDSFSWS
jgi:hypothetical protein